MRRQADQEVTDRWPHAWSELDRLRADPPGSWPRWCLLPSAATAMVIGGGDGDRPAPVAAVSALYAWRYARSVYVFEPELAAKLIAAGSDELGGIEVLRLPEWCVFVAGGRVEGHGAGLWAHLDYDAGTARPQLRLLAVRRFAARISLRIPGDSSGTSAVAPAVGVRQAAAGKKRADGAAR